MPKPALVVPAFDILKKMQKPALVVPALKFFKKQKPPLGMSAFPPTTKLTTLIKFLKLDVEVGFFFFSELHPYKTPRLV